ncbi:hypothetical protein E2C01_004002 [Portunus trituberculatus]|uniref:Uncharacterized protein n=1 Tax=Portunus trituberculatus TaxID=210409 RepID=A0A5B7CQC9_PORTR|nr:hypothetical protein [Portunus trituberculatus]
MVPRYPAALNLKYPPLLVDASDDFEELYTRKGDPGASASYITVGGNAKETSCLKTHPLGNRYPEQGSPTFTWTMARIQTRVLGDPSAPKGQIPRGRCSEAVCPPACGTMGCQGRVQFLHGKCNEAASSLPGWHHGLSGQGPIPPWKVQRSSVLSPWMAPCHGRASGRQDLIPPWNVRRDCFLPGVKTRWRLPVQEPVS